MPEPGDAAHQQENPEPEDAAPPVENVAPPAENVAPPAENVAPPAENVAPKAAKEVTFREAITGGFKAWRQFVITAAGSEVAAVLVMLVLVALTTLPLALWGDNKPSPDGKAPTQGCTAAAAPAASESTGTPPRVSDFSGQGGSLGVYTTRGSDIVQRESTLAVQTGRLTQTTCLATAVSDLTRSDGPAIPADQVKTWALTDSTGTRVTVYIQVSPRYQSVTAAGGYTGTVYLDDFRAVGGSVPVDIHVEYPYLVRAGALCFAAAWIGFFWAWLVNLTLSNEPKWEKFWLYIVLQLAVLIVVVFPVLNAQVLTNADWPGDLSHYIALATLAGGGALAATPTLRALIDRIQVGPGNGSPGSGTQSSADANQAPSAPQT